MFLALKFHSNTSLIFNFDEFAVLVRHKQDQICLLSPFAILLRSFKRILITVFTQFVSHPQIVPHCDTIQRVISLFLGIILIVLHL